ncbi:hypothetical protein LWI29_031493 [Acer saccharum]|uniref:Conserved oligomeric Golgi complex subunit 1 n=1 Tax=Acer saccharum TaxID=4024 RepID=A0AA39VHD6_ACESA|nr:hypothetical protein LWI29_031493 [Acer saccharum]
MRVASPSASSAADERAATLSGGGYRDAESLFRTKPISEIRNVELNTRKQIQEKQEDLRQLVGTRYRDLIDSADSIVLMKSSCDSISSNISSIHSHILSLSAETPKLVNTNPNRLKIYGIACRVKYLVDTPENIWGCFDESMFLDSAARPWNPAYADALAAVAVIDELEPKQVLALFLETRKAWILQTLGGNVASSDVSFWVPHPHLNWFGIPNPDEEVRLWKSFRDKLESTMVTLDKDLLQVCFAWLRDCGAEIVSKINGKFLIDAIRSGRELGLAEKLIRETMDSKKVLQGSLEWLKSVFGSEIELPWSRIRELILEDDSDLWDEIFEDAFVRRMKIVIDSGFEDLTRVVNVADSIHSIGGDYSGEPIDFQAYLNRPSSGGGVWFIEPNNIVKKGGLVLGHKATPEENDFQTCLNAYFGPEVSRIRDAVDNCCQTVLEDLLSFLESPKAALRLKDLAPYLQEKCYESMSTILTKLKRELDNLYAAMENGTVAGHPVPAAVIVERCLFIGRLLFAFQNHSKHIPVILGSPRFWGKENVAVVFDKLSHILRQTKASSDSPKAESPGRSTPTGAKRQSSSANALLGANESASPKLEELTRTIRDLCIRAHKLWILCDFSLRGWEETVVKQEQSDESQSDMKISLPSMPSLYIISFLCHACEEIHRIGGHVLDKSILQKFASRLLEKVTGIYKDFLSTIEAHGSQVSEKGVLQVLLDLRFTADVLSGGECNMNEDLSKTSKAKFPSRRKQDQNQTKSAIGELVDGLINRYSQRLDPIDWLTYEPYLRENERQAYLRHAVLFGFFVQLNRMYTDTVQKLPTNSESNIMRCSTVPRFKYLPISAPALSSRATTKTSIPAVSDDISSRGSWKAFTNGELSRKIDFDDSSSFGVATPFLKSFMQVGSRFGESTLKLGSILTDGQVGIFKDRSATMSSFVEFIIGLEGFIVERFRNKSRVARWIEAMVTSCGDYGAEKILTDVFLVNKMSRYMVYGIWILSAAVLD